MVNRQEEVVLGVLDEGPGDFGVEMLAGVLQVIPARPAVDR